MIFRVRVFGVPVQQGSKVPGRTKAGGLFVREAAGPKLKVWRDSIVDAALAVRGGMFTGAVELRVLFFMPRPASVPFSRRAYPTVAPDLDKLVRAVGDALTVAQVYKDDSLIVRLSAEQFYADSEEPGALITVSEII